VSSGPETRFIASVHRHLPPEDEFHREKMANPYRGGTADSWYSGKFNDLWVEWKFIEVPARADTMIDLISGKKPTLSVLQQDWLRDRYNEGRHVLVIVGSKLGGVVFETPKDWTKPLNAAMFRHRLATRAELADRIYTFCSL
jgi:hypothetical protein